MGEHSGGTDSGSFISQLFTKLAFTKEVEIATGKSTHAAQLEVERQIHQANKGGDPVKGKGVTKSGEED